MKAVTPSRLGTEAADAVLNAAVSNNAIRHCLSADLSITNRSADAALDVMIGRYTTVSDNVRFVLSRPRLARGSLFAFPSQTELDDVPLGSVVIGNDVYIGYGATVFGGLTIGDGAYVDDGAVVYADVPPYAVVAGNPAQLVEMRFDEQQIESLQQTKWWELADDTVTELAPLLKEENIEALVNKVRELRAPKLQIQRLPVLMGTPRETAKPPVDVLAKCGIDIVHGCQLRCVGCPNSTLKPKVKRMPVEDFGLILANIDVRRIDYLRLFNFGEPLLHDRLAEMLEQIPRQRFEVARVEISTNAQFTNWEQLEAAFRTGILGQLVVSCDGDGTPEEYERLRTPSKWYKLIEFLERAKDLRDTYQPKLPLITRTICSDSNAQTRWRALLEPRGWSPEFRDWMSLPQASQNLAETTEQISDGLCSFLQARNRLYVDWDGTVVPCCAHPRAAVLGNLMEQRFNDILSGSSRSQIEELMDGNRQSMPICNECFL